MTTLEVIGIVFAIRCFLGLVLLTSAMGKLANRTQFDKAVLDYGILPHRVARVYSAFLPWVELTLSLALFAGIALRLVGFAISVLLLSFIIAIVINLRRGRVLGCHCYGILSAHTIGWGIVVRNAILLVLAISLLMVASNALSLIDWRNSWEHDRLLLSSIDSWIPLSLLLAFGFVTLRLIEEGVNLSFRISRLET